MSTLHSYGIYTSSLASDFRLHCCHFRAPKTNKMTNDLDLWSVFVPFHVHTFSALGFLCEGSDNVFNAFCFTCGCFSFFTCGLFRSPLAVRRACIGIGVSERAHIFHVSNGSSMFLPNNSALFPLEHVRMHVVHGIRNLQLGRC